MTASDMTATKQRILDAAQEEFAAYGLAGARIDRIAKAANASKERLYAYFGDKVALFHAVLDANFLELLERHRGSAQDLPGEDMAGFAVTVFDDACRTPALQRMIIWGQLQGEAARMREQGEHHGMWSRHLDSIRRAQAAGIVAAQWEAEELLTLVFGVVFSWTVAPAVDDNATCSADQRARRREAVREAVTRMCRP